MSRTTVVGLVAGVVALGLCLDGAGAASAASRSAADPADLAVSLVLARTPAQHAAVARALLRQEAGDRTARAVELPAAGHRDAVLAWARSHGLQVVYSSPTLVEVQGASSSLSSLFATTLVPVVAAGQSAVQPAGPLTVPAPLAGDVESVVGLSTVPDLPAAAGSTSGSAAYGSPGLQLVTRVPGAPDKGYGAGAVIGTADLSPWYPDDITTWAKDPDNDGDPAAAIPFDRDTQLPHRLIGGVTTDQADPSTANPGASEVALDAEAILAVAPKAVHRQYFSTSRPADVLAVYDAMAQDAAAGTLTTVSTSYGHCERTLQEEQAYEDAVERIVAAGATFFAASGDDGSFGCKASTSQAVQSPASLPASVAVGGVSAFTTSSGITYAGWSPTSTSRRSSTGGPSALFPRPAYQPAALGSARAVPDIAGLATEPRFRTYSTEDGGYQLSGGTSLAAPAAAAALAGVVAAHGGTPVGDVHGLLYGHPEASVDVTTGNNGAFQAGPGHDLVTGLGVPDWTRLTALLYPGSTPAPAPAPTVSVAPAVISAGDTVTATWSGQPGQVVEVLSKTQPATGFSRLSTITLDGNGRATTTHRPQRNTRLTGRTAGTTDLGPSQPLVQVRSVASINVFADPGAQTVTGRVYPARATRLVSLYRNGVLAAQGRCDASGVYSLETRFRPGDVELYVKTGDDTYNLGTRSTAVTYTLP